MSDNSKPNIREIFKKIPSVDQLLSYCYEKYDIIFPKILLKQIIKKHLTNLRQELRNDYSINVLELIYHRIDKEIKINNKNKLTSIINGTGIVLHTGLGRSPISKKILKDTIENIYPYSNLELDIKNNKRGERNSHVSYLINALTTAKSSIIVNNNAAAVLLALNSFSENKDVIISRGELVEIGGSFRIPDVIKKANCNMVEIGTTNKTHLKDYINAINNNTRLIMIAHTSNYKVVGFTESVEIQELVKVGNKRKIPIFLDLGSGALINYKKYGLPQEKIIQEYIKMGVDIISFSGDKLLGGPQSGIICGKEKFIKKIHSNSMYRALRCDKITISLMESILKTYIDKDIVTSSNLSFELLSRSKEKLEKNGKLILKKINKDIISNYNIQLMNSNVEAGSGSLPIQNIESMALAFSNKLIKPTKISMTFRNSIPPILGYIKGNKFYIDLKAITKDQIIDLINTINNLK